MAEIVGVKVQLDGGEAIKTVGSLRQQLKAGLTDLQQMQEEFGDISPQAIAAAKSVAELRDRIKDSNEVASLFDPEKKFQAVVGVAQGIASGFAAAQGAMALFGAESKEVEQALLKVQATMALAQGLSGIKAATEDFKRLVAVLGNISIVQKANAAANALAAGTMKLFGAATTQTATAFNVLKGAIVATGIGAIVVLIGTLVQKMIDLASSTDDAAQAQRDLNKAMAEQANTFNDEIVDIYEKDKQLQIARAKAAGATEAEIVEITKKANEEITRLRRVNYLQQLGDGLDATDAQKKLNQQETDNELFELSVRQKAREDAEKSAEDAAAKAKTAREKDDATAKAAQEQKATDLKALGETFKAATEEQDQADKDAVQKKKDDDAAFIAYQNEIANAQIKAKDEQAKSEEEIARRKAQTEIDAAYSVANALNSFAQLAGEQTAAGKAFAIASATISAILGAQQAFTSLSSIPIYGTVLGAVAAAGAIAAGIANVKKIIAVKVPGQAGGGSAGALPSISAGGSAPLAPQRPATSTTRLDQDTVNNIGNAVPARAYVVESDITKSQARMDRIHRAAKFE